MQCDVLQVLQRRQFQHLVHIAQNVLVKVEELQRGKLADHLQQEQTARCLFLRSRITYGRNLGEDIEREIQGGQRVRIEDGHSYEIRQILQPAAQRVVIEIDSMRMIPIVFFDQFRSTGCQAWFTGIHIYVSRRCATGKKKTNDRAILPSSVCAL